MNGAGKFFLFHLLNLLEGVHFRISTTTHSTADWCGVKPPKTSMDNMSGKSRLDSCSGWDGIKSKGDKLGMPCTHSTVI